MTTLNGYIDRENQEIRLTMEGSAVYFCISLASAVDTVEQEESCSLSDIRITEDDAGWEAEVVWKSDIWDEKKHVYRFRNGRLEHWITVKGRGDIGTATYLSGTVDGDERGSIPGFGSVFVGCPNFIDKPFVHPSDYAANSVGNVTELWGSAMNGGPLMYAFGETGQEGWMTAGLHVQPGQYNFHTMAWNKKRSRTAKVLDNIVGTQSISLDYFGHVRVDGEWISPTLVFSAANDPQACLRAYCDDLRTAGLVPAYTHTVHDWWSEPILCTWHEQVALAMARVNGASSKEEMEGAQNCFGIATQANLCRWLKTLEDKGVVPGTIIIDAMWQKDLTGNHVDTEKFPDLRGFIDERHAQGQRVVLWMKAWEIDDIPDEWCVCRDGKPIMADPTHPEYRKFVSEMLVRMLSDAPGCYNGDGLKIDGTNDMPSGVDLATAGQVYGFELLHNYLKMLFDGAKAAKEDAYVSLYTGNPYFNDCCDSVRTGDLYTFRGDPLHTLAWRSDVFKAALPGKPIDTDGCLRFNMCESVENVLAAQVAAGVPCIYQAENLIQRRTFAPARCRKLEEKDYEAIRKSWAEYRQGLGKERVK